MKEKTKQNLKAAAIVTGIITVTAGIVVVLTKAMPTNVDDAVKVIRHGVEWTRNQDKRVPGTLMVKDLGVLGEQLIKDGGNPERIVAGVDIYYK